MPLRTAIFRAMLGLLGLAALTGVASVLLLRETVMWRIIGTELSAACACGLFLPCLPMIDRVRTRAAGLLGMTGVLVEFVIAIVLIWELTFVFLGVRWESELALTMVLLGFSFVASIRLLPETHGKEQPVAAWSGITVVVLTLAACLPATWLPRRGWGAGAVDGPAEHLWETAAVFLAMGALVSVCLLGLGGSPRRRWRWLGVGAAGAGSALWLWDIWIGSGSDLGFAIFAGLVTLSAVVAYAIGCGLCPLKPTQVWFRTGTIGAAIVTGALIELLILDDRQLIRGLDDLWIGRCTAALGIVTGCGTLALAVLAGMNRGIDAELELAAMTDITVVCPRCRKRQSLPIGEAACGGCQLRISIRVEEPRCRTCDYLLIGRVSDRCPECGTVV